MDKIFFDGLQYGSTRFVIPWSPHFSACTFYSAFIQTCRKKSRYDWKKKDVYQVFRFTSWTLIHAPFVNGVPRSCRTHWEKKGAGWTTFLLAQFHRPRHLNCLVQSKSSATIIYPLNQQIPFLFAKFDEFHEFCLSADESHAYMVFKIVRDSEMKIKTRQVILEDELDHQCHAYRQSRTPLVFSVLKRWTWNSDTPKKSTAP